MSNQVNDENVGLLKQLVTTVQKKNDKEKVDNSIKMKPAKVIGVDEDTYKVFVYFIDDIEQNAYTFYNKSGEVLSEGDNVRVYYTTNPAKGWIGARCGEPSIKEFENTENSTSPLTGYEYLTDLSVKCNGVTYTVEKDSTTGLISKISDSNGNSFEPTINSGITDIAWHNAVFAAVAIHSGLKVIPDLVLFSGLNGQWEFKNGLTGFQNIKIDAQTYSGLGKTIYSSGVAVGSLTKSYGRNNQLDGYTNACVIRSNEKIDLTKYRKLKISAVAYKNYSGITGAAYFRTGEPAAAQSNVVYDFTEWTKICNCDITSMNYAAPGTPTWYEIDISGLTGSHYINLAIQHGSENLVYTAYFDMQQIILTNQ